METYRKYFDIDPDFFPAVNNDVIKKEPNLWKKFFPHETFIKLIKQVVSVLDRKQKLNVWVEGAYGTGKSHAVLTLKHLLDASVEDTDEYFKQFNIDDDLRKKFVSTKSQGKIITVHRYGSSSIHSDNDLFLAMQESIESALEEAGIQNAGPNALKDGIINYLSDEENKQSFGVFVNGSYKELFNGETVDDIIKHLSEYKDLALQTLMNKIFKVANEKNIKAFTLDDVTMLKWITEVISANQLKVIVFIWDEFTEYFSNNAHRLTGFQHILDLSQTEPFCFIPVTHRSDAGMDDADADKTKILGRFIHPTCIIELPENMAFQLMGAAMQKKDDEVIRNEWENDILHDLEERTHDSRERIKKVTGINDEQLRGILPIHPYAACLLKHISASFASNQRSMFDFIKNSGNSEQLGFQWYMDNYGPLEPNPFLTIDLLWGYFYENGKDELSQAIRQILDRYPILAKSLEEDEQKVLKTILLFQAMSQSAGDSVEIFLPNEKNLNYAFEGSDFDSGQAVKCAEKLIRDKVIYKKNLKDGNFLYSVLTGEMDAAQIEKKKGDFESRTTSFLIKEGQLDEAIELSHDLKLRFNVSFAGPTDFDSIAKKALNDSLDSNRYFYVVAGLSKDERENIALSKKIKAFMEANPDSNVIIIDCGKSPLKKENFEKWVEYMATASYYSGKNNDLAATYNNYAKSVLSQWKVNVKQGQFVLYTKLYPSGENINSIDTLSEELRNIDRKRFALALECNYKSISNWWIANSLQVGVECGVTRTIKGTYNNNNANLKKALGDAWDNDNYWNDHPSEPISRIKIGVEDLIQTKLKEDGRISIQTIYEFLKGEPYGFLPCNMTAFFMGFILKEYVDEKYSWSDDMSSDNMSLQKMKEMVEEIIKLDNTPNPRYRQKYIVTMTPEEKFFIEGTSVAFGIAKKNCSSVESARDSIRAKMKENLLFPIWTLGEILSDVSLDTSADIIQNLISLYQDLANNTTGKSDTEIANEIGKLYISNAAAAVDLQRLFTSDNCRKGMLKYLDRYNSGELPVLAKLVGDGGQYINELKKKIDAGDANWGWKQETIDQQIEVVILEYKITAESSELLSHRVSYRDAIAAWNEKCGNIKLAYETVKNYTTEINPLLYLLKEIKQHGTLAENKKQDFLNYLQGYGSQFNSFYVGQLDIFKKACNFYIQDFNDSDKAGVFKKISSGCFTWDNASYCNMVQEACTEYKKELGSLKLKALWYDNTNTDNPLKWSEKYKMPIQALIPLDEWQECRSVFDVINSPNPSDRDIEKALTYLEHFKYWSAINDEKSRDVAFKEKMLGDKAVMIEDVNSIREYLSSHVSELPYHWMGNPQVQNVLEQYAEAEYNRDGYAVAMKKIDSMGAEDVKKYLKDLIRNNMKVGIQIIKDNL